MAQPWIPPHLERREARGEPLALHGKRITPIKRAVHVTWPGGAWLWQRPVAVEVHEGGRTWRISVHNATRRAIFGLALSAAFVAVVMRRRLRTRGKQEQERESNR